MDGHQFDDLLRRLTNSRRSLLGAALAAGGLATGLTASDAKKKNKKKNKRCRGCRPCTSCVKGKCLPLPDRTPCGGECSECMGGQCVDKAANTVCSADGRCLNGICNSKPDCISFNVGGCIAIPNCCSGICNDPPAGGVCAKASAGQLCKVNLDCTSNVCLGYRCQ